MKMQSLFNSGFLGFAAGVCVALAFIIGVGNSKVASLHESIEKLERKLSAEPDPWTQNFEAGRLVLPDDANQWHTVLIVNSDYQANRAQRAAVTMFEADPGLHALKLQTHFHLIKVESPEFHRFKACVDAVPCLIVERPSGQVIYRESGPQLGEHHHGLIRAMRREVERHCPDGKCLPLHPVPQPAPTVPDVPPAAVVNPPVAVEPPRDNTAAGVVLAALTAAAGFAIRFRRAAGM
ncbi:MAG: hypothetical protein KGL39_31765 [Patescibacteria group bacterium]|nr:hypothetical protein [Patescibacteria group bacterium]